MILLTQTKFKSMSSQKRYMRNILKRYQKSELVSFNEVKEKLQNLNINKSLTNGSFPAAILEQCVEA